MAAETRVQISDPEAEFLNSKQETGYEWELFKENVRPLKRGRNVGILNHALKSQSDHQLKKDLIEKRRKLIEAIDEYDGDDPLFPWIECIKWVQEAFPPGGECSGLLVIYEQCVRKFWHSERYKDDLRYLKVWLEYAEHCADAEVIYKFLEVNEIGKTHAVYYIANALHMEFKNKVKTANEIFNLGISRNAKPVEKLNDAYKKFMVRTMRRSNTAEEQEPKENSDLPSRSFGTLLSRGDNNARRQVLGSSNIQAKKPKPTQSSKTPFAIYTDAVSDTTSGNQPESDKSKPEFGSWLMLGGRAERNKENNSLPRKWASFKVPQKPIVRTAPASASTFEVFVDEEECTEERGNKKKTDETISSSSNALPLNDGLEIKKETELLRQNPLRHFPPNSFLR
ncbi:PREDICTED: mitotic spindle checkpoint protein BUBR1-like isoform X1 [Camelina sativa]|uniref:Mitotic spindle checkpoint protein BUBR1-like isoform X1 n=1 Tax=Camelina sativa TaxID=90675 RepID=A0ABM0Z3E6_CAMSA|nr:PREDICTED: mitotic spindle checkpoint protein BUBR1-like isoform X1 [Camelina sativa]